MLKRFTIPRSSAIWLVYLGMLAVYPAFATAQGDWRPWLTAALIVIVFLPVYGWTERHIGFRPYLWRGQPGAVLGVLGVIALGVVGSTANPGATVLFVFASTSGAGLRPTRLARAMIVAAGAAVILAFLLSEVEMPWRYWAYAPALLFTLLMGAVSLYSREGARANARLKMAHEEIERLAQVAERERIARDLHDVLGHTLSTITLKSELAGRLVRDDPQRALQEIGEVEEISRQALSEVREALSGYRASGLQAEIANARLALEAAGIAFDYYVEPLDLGPTAETAAALALREAITNLVRHAGATRARVRFERDGSQALLRVEDDGKWSGDREHGAGLSGMRARVEAVGGRLTVTPSSRGTTVAVSLPLVGTRTSAASHEPAAGAS